MSLDSIANSCFVCGPSNSNGLKVRFSIRDDVCLGVFTPSEDHVGYDNVTHGGIIFSLLNDVMANWLWLHDEQCFTAKADIRYYQKLPIGIEVRLEGRCNQRKGRLAKMSGEAVRTDNGETIAVAFGSFMVPTA